MNVLKFPLLISLAAILPSAFPQAPKSADELDVSAALGEKAEARLVLPVPLALFETPRADRVMERLAAGQEVVVTGMNANGLKVRARGRNGQIRGWISRKLALGDDPAIQNATENWYRRERLVATIAAQRSVALNLSTGELERIFGTPTRRTLSDGGDGVRVEKLEWVRTETLEFDKGLTLIGLDKNSPLARSEIETARLTVECRNGIVTAFDGSLEPATPATTLEIPAPFPCPFTVVAIVPPTAAERAGN